MNLQQMRCLSEVVRHGLGVSAAARTLNISQPAVTKQLRQLENELGAPLFIHERHRIVGLTPMGQQVVKLAQEVCLNVNAIKRLGKESRQFDYGEIKIATTHAQAKFVLPELMQHFSERFKNVKFVLEQALPPQIISAVASGEVDLGVTPETDPGATDVTFLPYRSYPRIILFPKDHPLLKKKCVSLKMLASYPIITTGVGLAGRTEVFSVFAANNILPNVQLSAPDFDVVKVCVERGLGIAILPSYTYEPHRDEQIRTIDASNIFPPSITSIVVRRNPHLPRFVYQFLNLLIPGKWNV